MSYLQQTSLPGVVPLTWWRKRNWSASWLQLTSRASTETKVLMIFHSRARGSGSPCRKNKNHPQANSLPPLATQWPAWLPVTCRISFPNSFLWSSFNRRNRTNDWTPDSSLLAEVKKKKRSQHLVGGRGTEGGEELGSTCFDDEETTPACDPCSPPPPPHSSKQPARSKVIAVALQHFPPLGGMFLSRAGEHGVLLSSMSNS